MGCAFTKKYQGKEDHGGLLITKEVKEIFFCITATAGFNKIIHNMCLLKLACIFISLCSLEWL